MNELNINGRKLEELPNKEMIEDILLELTDTENFHVDFYILDPYRYSSLNKSGDVVVYEMECNKQFVENNYDNPIMMSYRAISKRYEVIQRAVGIRVQSKQNIKYSNIEVSKYVYKKLMSYLKNDIINYRVNSVTNFEKCPIYYEIDFIISDIKMLK
jgi:hypothetical protein